LANTNFSDAIRSHILAALGDVYTALPARVDSYDNKTRTVSATPLIRRIYGDDVEQVSQSIDSIPLMFPSGGGAEVTFPIKKGDQVLLIFSMRNIQDWMISEEGDEITPSLVRHHSIQDAIAIPSMFTTKQAREANPDHMELIFGASKIQIQEDSKIVVESGTVELGEGANQAAVLGDTFMSLFNSHSHLTAGTGPPTPPTTPMTPAHLSTQVKVK
jgi:hypothetical protein